MPHVCGSRRIALLFASALPLLAEDDQTTVVHSIGKRTNDLHSNVNVSPLVDAARAAAGAAAIVHADEDENDEDERDGSNREAIILAENINETRIAAVDDNDDKNDTTDTIQQEHSPQHHDDESFVRDERYVLTSLPGLVSIDWEEFAEKHVNIVIPFRTPPLVTLPFNETAMTFLDEEVPEDEEIAETGRNGTEILRAEDEGDPVAAEASPSINLDEEAEKVRLETAEKPLEANYTQGGENRTIEDHNETNLTQQQQQQPEQQEQPAEASSSSSTTTADVVVVDYASKSAGALILEKSANFQGTSNLLVSDKDKYAIVPCHEETKSIVVGLSEDIHVKQVGLANYEHYSSRVQTFQVAGSQTMDNWFDLGTYTASSIVKKQTFDLNEPAWARYLRFRFISHYGDEHYCTISQISVHGATMLQGFHEEWEAEEEGQQEEKAVDEENSVQENGEQQQPEDSDQRPAESPDTGSSSEEVQQLDAVVDESETLQPSEPVVQNDATEESTGEDIPTNAEVDYAPRDDDAPIKPLSSSLFNCVTELHSVCPRDWTFEEAMFLYTGLSNKSDFDILMTGALSAASVCRYSSSSSSSSSNRSSLSFVPDRNSAAHHAASIHSRTSESYTDENSGSKEPSRLDSASLENDDATASPSSPVMQQIKELTSGLQVNLEKIGKGFLRREHSKENGGSDGGVSDTGNVGMGLSNPESGNSLDGTESVSKDAPTKASAPPTAPTEETGNGDSGNVAPAVNGGTENKASGNLEQQQQQQQQLQDHKDEGIATTGSSVASDKAAVADDSLPSHSQSGEQAAKPKAKVPPTEGVESGEGAENNVPADRHPDTANLEVLHETGQKLADRIVERIPSAKCLKDLDFIVFKAAAQKAKSGAGAGGHAPASGGNSAMEPIFKKLTGEIKALQASVIVHDQFTVELVSCYQRVLLDLFVEMEEVRVSHDARLSRMEQEILLQHGSLGRWFTSMKDVVSWLLSHVAVIAISTVYISLGFLRSVMAPLFSSCVELVFREDRILTKNWFPAILTVLAAVILVAVWIRAMKRSTGISQEGDSGIELPASAATCEQDGDVGHTDSTPEGEDDRDEGYPTTDCLEAPVTANDDDESSVISAPEGTGKEFPSPLDRQTASPTTVMEAR